MTLISIVIPCRNEEQYIGKCLESIISTHKNGFDIEVFVCDGLSNDNTESIIAEYTNKYNFIHKITNSQKVTPIALNLGIQASKGDYIAILGAHSTLTPNYFTNTIECFNKNKDVDCVGGIIENVFEDEKTRSIGLAMSSPFGVGNAFFRTGLKSGYVDTVAFGIYKKSVFEDIGLFDETLVRNQDDEFNFRLLKYNKKIYLDFSIVSKYYVRSGFKKLFKQYYQYGFWKVLVNKNHKTITTIRQLFPFFLVSSLITLALGSFFIKYFAFLLIFEILLWLIFSIYFALKKVENLHDFFKIIYSFAILHISYGYGYLLGIIWFIIFKQKPQHKHGNLTR